MKGVPEALGPRGMTQKLSGHWHKSSNYWQPCGLASKGIRDRHSASSACRSARTDMLLCADSADILFASQFFLVCRASIILGRAAAAHHGQQ